MFAVILMMIVIASGNLACGQTKPAFIVQPTVVSGYNGTCPSQRVTEETRQNISNNLRNILSCLYKLLQYLDNNCLLLIPQAT